MEWLGRILWLAGVALLCYAPFYKVPRADEFYRTTLQYSVVHTWTRYDRKDGSVVIRTKQGKSYEIMQSLLERHSKEGAAALLRESSEATIWLTDPEDKYIWAIKSDRFEIPVERAIAWFEMQKRALLWLGFFAIALGTPLDYWLSKEAGEYRGKNKRLRELVREINREQKRGLKRAKMLKRKSH